MDWYLSVSRDRGVGPRCPFATVQRCPRFYLSTWVLNEVDNQPQDEALHDRWRRSELYPTRDEELTSSSGSPTALHYGKFCPEVAYERFGRFASELTEYFDAYERQAGQQQVKEGGPEWKSDWLAMTPRHYTECPLYAPLLHSPTTLTNENLQNQKANDITKDIAPILSLKPAIWGMSVDLHQVWRRVRKWLADRASRSL